MICLCIYGPVFTVYLHSHKKRKDSLKTRAVMLIFLVEFGISSVEFVRAGRTEHTSYIVQGNDFEAVLATFCCYDHGAKASELVQKIATDQKEYRKCSLCVIIC